MFCSTARRLPTCGGRSRRACGSFRKAHYTCAFRTIMMKRAPWRDIYRDLIKLRKQYAPFHNGRVVWLRNSAEADLVTFMRLDGKDEFVVAINFSNRPVVG